MRHRWGFRRLGRDSRHRKALLKNLATALIKNERIMTTVAKAKELRRVGDKMITLGKRGTDTSRKKAWNWMREPSLVDKLFGTLSHRYADRPGGYTRVLRAPNRKGDNAPMAVVELVGNSYPPLRPPRTKRTEVSDSQEAESVELSDNGSSSSSSSSKNKQLYSSSVDPPSSSASSKTVVPPEGTPV